VSNHSPFDLRAYVETRRSMVDKMLEAYLPESSSEYEKVLVDAMRYSLFAGGKRLRPILCIAGAEAVGGGAEDVLFLACGIEMIHTYSLIHDDLPAMDNDELRRGMPTSHIMFGEAIAILAGDGLLTEAFRILSDPKYTRGCDPKRLLRVIHLLSEASGYKGMVGGQAMDMLADLTRPDLDLVDYIHTHKTGELITASVVSGAMLLGADEFYLTKLKDYGHAIGLAFQIWDDILDIEGDALEMGKQPGSDQRQNKATYPFVVGIQKAKEKAHQLVRSAVESLQIFGKEADPLRAIAQYITERRK